MIKQIK